MAYEITNYAPRSGRIIGEDGNVYNIVDLLQNSGGGGSSSMRHIFGTSDPTSSDGQPGDVFINTNSGDLFANENGAWNKQGNLKGPKGAKGDTGAQGPAGADGVSVTGATSDGTNITFELSDGSTFDVPWPAQ